jgi:hypothetical protein
MEEETALYVSFYFPWVALQRHESFPLMQYFIPALA